MSTLTRLTDGVQWLFECDEVGGLHLHRSQYLVEADDSFVLVDAGSGHEAEMIEAVRTGTEDADLDTVLLTHSILPHVDNLEDIREEWRDVNVISATRVPELVGLSNVEPKFLNATTEIAGETFSFLDPLLTDVVASNWIYNHGSGTLFTTEGVGHYHDPGDCVRTSSGLDGGIAYEHVDRFNRDKLPYVHLLDSEKLRAGFEAVFDRFDVRYVAPIHGTPVEPSHVEAYVELVHESVADSRATSPYSG